MICFVFIGQKGLNKERGMSKLSTYRFFRKPYSFCHTMLTGDIHKWEKRKSPSLVCKLTFLVRKSIVICRFGPNSVKAWALTHVTKESKLELSRNFWNGILFPKLFWPTVRKKCSLVLVEDREFAKILRSRQQFINVCDKYICA